MLLSLDVKFVKIFRKGTMYYKGHCNSSPNLHNRLIHMDIITASQNSVCILDSLMQHVSGQHEAIMKKMRHKVMVM